MSLELRPVTPEDEPFLFEVYSGTRAEEMSAWGWDAAQREAFLKMQFMAQRRSYEMQQRQARHSIILFEGQPAGRLYVVRSEDAIHLTDISLLEEYRGRGIGTRLITELLEEAARGGVPCRLQVLKSNAAARRLYERLGFAELAGDAMYSEMEWRASAGLKT